MYFVYILYSEKFQKYYVGQTNDYRNRLLRHNSGLVKSTKSFAPWKMIFVLEKPNRSESVILETKLKNLSKIRINRFIKKYQSQNLIISGPDEA